MDYSEILSVFQELDYYDYIYDYDYEEDEYDWNAFDWSPEDQQRSDEIDDAEGAKWSFESRFTLSAEGNRIKTAYRLSCDQNRQLIHFQGPTIHAGEKNFGSAKSFALFPGLEF